MKKHNGIIAVFAFALLLAAGACSKYQTQFEGPYEDDPSDAPDPSKVLYEIAYVDNGILTMSDRYFKNTKTFPSVQSGVYRASINYSHDKIAYKGVFENIRIIDSSGNFIKEIPGTEDAVWFDWHANNETLYMMNASNNAGVMYFDGPTVSAPFANMKGSSPFIAFSSEFNSAVLLPDGGVVFDFYVPGFNPFHYLIGIFPQGSSYQDFELTLPQYERASWMRSSADGKTIVIGSEDYSSHFWQLDVQNASVFEVYESAELVALSPEGTAQVRYYNNYLTLPQNGLGKSTNGSVSSLDW